MNSQDDETGRAEARRNFERSRHRFDDGEEPSFLKRSGHAVGSAWRGAGRFVPGGVATLWVLLAIVLVFVAVVMLAGFEARMAAMSNKFDRGAPQPVGVAKAAYGDIRITLDELGTVTPLATATVRPQVSGVLDKVVFHEGDMVKAGDLLAEIDPRPFQAALDQAKGQLLRDQANLANAQLDLKRDEALYKSNATSQQTLDTQQALVKSDQGVVNADQANVDSAAINLGYTRITAPVSGRAGIRQVDVGNFVSAGQTSGIVVITQLQPMSVLFTVPEDNIDQIVRRMNSGDVLSADAYDHPDAVKLASGHLVATDSEVDQTTGTVKLRAMFENANDELFPGEFVNVHLLVKTLHNQVVVPSAAIQLGASGSFVFVVKPDHTVQMRTVIQGDVDGDNVSIAKGLNVGETVVTDGADRLRDGSEVTIPSGQAVPAVAAAQNATALTGQDARNAERAKRQAEVEKACGADIAKFCAGMEGRERFMCLRENADKMSATCQETLKAMRGDGGGRRGGFGGARPPG